VRGAWAAFHFLESASTASWRSSLVCLVCIFCGPAVKFVASEHDRHMHLKYHEKDLVSTSKCLFSQTLIAYSNARARTKRHHFIFLLFFVYFRLQVVAMLLKEN